MECRVLSYNQWLVLHAALHAPNKPTATAQTARERHEPAMKNPAPRSHALIERARARGPAATAVVYPCSGPALAGALEAATAGLIAPVLIGPRPRIEQIAAEQQLDLAGCVIHDMATAEASARHAAALARSDQHRCNQPGGRGFQRAGQRRAAARIDNGRGGRAMAAGAFNQGVAAWYRIFHGSFMIFT